MKKISPIRYKEIPIQNKEKLYELEEYKNFLIN